MPAGLVGISFSGQEFAWVVFQGILPSSGVCVEIDDGIRAQCSHQVHEVGGIVIHGIRANVGPNISAEMVAERLHQMDFVGDSFTLRDLFFQRFAELFRRRF